MKLIASLLIVFALLDSVAVAEWPLHQNYYGTNSGPAKTFFDSHCRYVVQTPIYPPAMELHQANGFGRTLPYPAQPLPETSHTRGRRTDGVLKP